MFASFLRFNIFEKIPVRLRLSLGYGITLGLVLLGIGVGVLRLIERNIFESLDTTLLTSAKAIRDSGLSRDKGEKRLRNSAFWWSILDEFYDGERLAIRSYAQMVEPSGRVSAKTANVGVRLPVTPHAVARAELGLPTFETFVLEARGFSRLRQVTLPRFQKGRFTGELIQVGAPMDGNYRMISRIKYILLISLTLALIVSVFFAYILTKSAFRPVVKISRAASIIGVDDLKKRLPLPLATDELRDLTETFNGMICRLDDAFVRLRRFSGDVSHELRTPLAVLKGEAELALRKDRSKEDYRLALRRVVLEAKHMSTIVEDLLLLARAHDKSLALQLEMIPTVEIIAWVENDLCQELARKAIDLKVINRSHLGVFAAKNYLSIVVKNLVLNAIKHSHEQGEIIFEVEESDDDFSFAVEDRGEGISKTDLPYIFDTFFRADTARNRSLGGSGIGLSLSKALVDLHGGDIRVASSLGDGCRFEVTIPKA